jgi:TolB protein
MLRSLATIALALLTAQAYTPLSSAAKLTHVPNPQRHPTNDEPFPAPDGTELVIESNRTGKQQLYAISSDGKLLRRITSDNALDDTPTWSRDGHWIAYVAIRGKLSWIAIVAAGGGAARQIAGGDGLDYLHPTWSVDDRWIMYNVNSRREPQTYELWAMRPDGSRRHAVTHTDYSETTYGSWSPDGLHMVYRRKFPPYRSQIFIADADGKHPRNISNDDAYDGWPSWSPDGRAIVFASNRLESQRASLNEAIFLMAADGSRVRLLARTSGRNTEPRFAPGGKTVYFSHCVNHECEVFSAALEPERR